MGECSSVSVYELPICPLAKVYNTLVLDVFPRQAHEPVINNVTNHKLLLYYFYHLKDRNKERFFFYIVILIILLATC